MAVTVMQGVEPIIDAMVTRLRAELAGAVDTVNGRDTKGIVLPYVAPEAVLDYVPTPAELNVFPCIAIEDGPSRIADDIGWTATGVDDLVVVIFDQHHDQRELALRLRRWQLIVRSVLLQGRDLDPAWGVVDKGSRPGPTLGREEDPRDWMSWTAIMVECRSEQDQLP